jgi:CRISPR-associated protein Cas5d
MNDNRITIRVWGDYACFTRPEMKVERVSYPVMTPSAARGILEAIFWEPQIHYLIDTIHIIKRGRWFSFRRNEVISVISLDSARNWMKTPEKVSPIQAGGGAPDGTQRNMLALQEVEYLITAEVCLTGIGKDAPHGLPKYCEEVKRRTKSGKCFHRPAFGVREFSANFEFEENAATALVRRRNEFDADGHTYSEDLGLMLYDVFSTSDRAIGFQWLPEEIESNLDRPAKRKTKQTAPHYAGTLAKPQAIFFHAAVKDGCLDCHPSRVQFARRGEN